MALVLLVLISSGIGIVGIEWHWICWYWFRIACFIIGIGVEWHWYHCYWYRMALVYLLLVKNGIWYGYKLALVLMISVFAQHLKRSTIVNDKWGERALACCCASTNWG